MPKKQPTTAQRAREDVARGAKYTAALRARTATSTTAAAAAAESQGLPEPLRQAIQSMTAEAVMNCQEVMRYTEPDRARDWKRMTLYRATDAADAMNALSLLIAAYCQRTGTSPRRLDQYLQASYQHDRTPGPAEEHRAEVAALLGEDLPEGLDRGLASYLRIAHADSAGAHRDDDTDVERVWTAACLHGLRARLCDDVDALDTYLPPHIATIAKKIAQALDMPQPATAGAAAETVVPDVHER
ncbi:hypothetical protein [Streptomyces sp. NPDC006552]|uniref:hypothetical protein n=1 Tax=Streptomyces sp. NPDC006552 TaxID=3157179 RepID=UPI0033B5B922